MSGTGVPDFTAPDRLTTITGDQPVGTTTDGHWVMPSFYFLQFLQRLLSYIGQPTGNSGTTLTTIAAEALDAAQQALVQVTNIENTALSIQAQLASGLRGGDIQVAAAPPFNPNDIWWHQLPAAPNLGLTQAQALARMTFVGGRW